MLRSRLAALCVMGAGSGVVLLHCVGDSPVVVPSGPDSSTTDQTSPPTDGPAADTSTGDSAAPPPSPDGGLVWVEHYNTNYQAAQIAVREGSTPSYVIAGSYRNAVNGPLTKLGNITPPATQNAIAPLVYSLDVNGNVTWAKGIANNGDNVYFDSVAVDVAGDVYLSGWMATGANITFAQAHSGTHQFVTKLKGDGSGFVWDHTFVASGGNFNSGRLAVFGGQVFITFGWTGDLTDDATLAKVTSNGPDIFIAALSTTDGKMSWSKTIGGAGNEASYGIGTDQLGDVYVAGIGDGSIAGPGTGFPIASVGTGSNAIVFKLSGAKGDGVWGRAFGDTNNSYTYAGALGVRGGTVAITGSFYGSVDFGSGVVGSAGGGDGYVASLDATNGKTKFATTIGGTSQDDGLGVGVDAWGDVMATATYNGNDAKVGTNKPLSPSFFAAPSLVNVKWSPTGALLWSNTVVSTAPDGKSAPYPIPDAHADPSLPISGLNLAVSNSGDVFVAGKMIGGGNFGDGVYRARLSTISDPNLIFPQGGCLFKFAPCPNSLAPDSLVVHLLP